MKNPDDLTDKEKKRLVSIKIIMEKKISGVSKELFS